MIEHYDNEPWHLPHMNNCANDANLIQADSFGVVRDGRMCEMACVAPEPEPSFWRSLWDFLKAPRFNA